MRYKKKRRLADFSNIELDVNTTILGVSEGDGVQHSQMKEKIRKEYYRRIRMELRKQTGSHQHLGSTSRNLQF